MAVAIHGVLAESRQYYRQMKTETVARLLINPRGHVRTKRIDGNQYLYLRATRSGIRRELYLGPAAPNTAERIAMWTTQSKRDIGTLREVKAAMKELKMPGDAIRNEDYTHILKGVAELFDAEGLWEHGLELIGSWCFRVYQGSLGVEDYPERTLDVDFAIALPYTGPSTDIGNLLKRLGFIERFHQDGSIKYESGAFEVEFLKDRRGDGSRRGKADGPEFERDLGIAPVAIPYLRLLLENRMTIQARDIGKVVIPSMPAFMLHKLLVGGKRRKADKRLKDLRQAEAVAKAILADEGLVAETKRIAAGMHKKWLQAIVKEAAKMDEIIPGHSGAVQALLRAIEG